MLSLFPTNYKQSTLYENIVFLQGLYHKCYLICSCYWLQTAKIKHKKKVSLFNPQLTEKNACIFYRWGPLDPNYVIFEKSLDYLQIYFSLVQNTLKYTNLCFPIVGCCNCYNFK